MKHDEKILIRASDIQDSAALARLATLDSTDVPRGRVLLAEVDGSLRAALPLDGGRPIADPFAESAHLLELLAAHARAFPGDERSHRRGLRRRGRLVPATA